VTVADRRASIVTYERAPDGFKTEHNPHRGKCAIAVHRALNMSGKSREPLRALVTGARRGIGRGIAVALGAAGFDVVINDLAADADSRDAAAAVRATGAGAAFVAGDVADLAGHERLLDAAFAAFGGLEVLVNNAGISVAKRGDLLETTAESFDRVIGVNLRGPFFLTQCLARRWLADPAPPGRRAIISLGSANSVMASIDRGEYCLSKTGISMMTQLFALRLAEAGIGVFEIRPGVIRTEMTRVAAARYDARIADGLVPAGRWGAPEDIGRVAAALASGAFAFATGAVVPVDGGLQIQRL
jgi:3-oxoacyl-[acyl-carrier protein] reductase